MDTDRRLIVRQGKPVHLSPKAFELLELLIASRPRVVAKSELLARLWPGTFVVEANLSNLTAEIRAALGDDRREQRFVRTAHGYGYGFSGEVAGDEAPAPGMALCWLLHHDHRIALGEGEHGLGRHPRSIVPIDCSAVSRKHARIVVSGGGAVLTDLGSRNGTWLGERRVQEPTTLADGDAIRLGSVLLIFRASPLDESTDEQRASGTRPPS